MVGASFILDRSQDSRLPPPHAIGWDLNVQVDSVTTYRWLLGLTSKKVSTEPLNGPHMALYPPKGSFPSPGTPQALCQLVWVAIGHLMLKARYGVAEVCI